MKKVFCSQCIYYDGGDLCYAKEHQVTKTWKGERHKPELCEDKNWDNSCQQFIRASKEYDE